MEVHPPKILGVQRLPLQLNNGSAQAPCPAVAKKVSWVLRQSGTQVSRFSEEVLSQVARLSLTRSSTQPNSKLKEVVPNKACQTSSNSPSAYHRALDFAEARKIKN